MILIDFSQIAYACAIEFLIASKQRVAEVPLVRHMILNTMRSNVKKFRNDYGEIVVAYDSKTYWRKERFPHYKSNRKKSREKSAFDWNSIFHCMDTIRPELKQYLPYKVVEVEGAEADDIIGTLTLAQPMGEKVLILSGDKDFVQLQMSAANVIQYSPFLKAPMKDEQPSLTLKQHIIQGDKGDGIPNILSPDDVFVSGGRQKPIHEKKIIQWLQQDPQDFCTVGDMLRNFKRNQELIDLQYIPGSVKSAILDKYAGTTHPTKSEFLNYLATSGLKELSGSINDF